MLCEMGIVGNILIDNIKGVFMKKNMMILGVTAIFSLFCVVGYASEGEWIAVQQSTHGQGPFVDVQGSDNGFVVTMEVSGFYAQELKTAQGDFSILSIPECGMSALIGHPDMPFRGLILHVPHGVDVDAKVLKGQSRVALEDVEIYPRQAPEPDSRDYRKNEAIFAKEGKVYESDGWFPQKIVNITSDAIVRGQRFIFLEVFPLQYNPVKREVIAWPQLSLEINFQGEIDYQAEEMKLERMNSIVNKKAFKFGEADDISESLKSNPTGTEYLIIAHDDFISALAPFVTWKRLKGLTVELVAISSVGNNPTSIKNYLTSYYNSNPDFTYLLLVGDHAQIQSEYKTIPLDTHYTDQEYACLDGTDYYPDISMGRISVQTTTDCTNVINKIIDYERNPVSGSWYDDFLMAGLLQDYDDYNCWADRWFYETATHIMHYMRDTVSMDIHTAATSDSLSCSPYYWKFLGYPHRMSGYILNSVPTADANLITSGATATQDVSTAINSGVSLVLHRDHGGTTSWGDPYFSKTHINALTNGSKLPVVLSVNCLTGRFTYSTSDCFAEAFLKKSSGGCVGIVAATEVSYSGYNDLLARGMIDCYWDGYDTSDGGNIYNHSWRPAEAMMYGKYYMRHWHGISSTTEYSFELFHYHGDPEMMLTTANPTTLVVSMNCPILPGSSSMSVNCNVNGALVAVTHNGTLLGRATVSGGVANVSLNPAPSNGWDLDIVVTGHNINPYEGICSVGAASPTPTPTVTPTRTPTPPVTPTPTPTVTPTGGIPSLDCSNAVSIQSGVPYDGSTVGGAANVDLYNCSAWNESGPEIVHQIVTGETGTITAVLTNIVGGDLDVFLLSSCDANACSAYGNTEFTYDSAPPGTYYVVVDGYTGASGTYTLTIDYSVGDAIFGDVPVGHWCRTEIEAIYNAGITSGCQGDPMMFCPDTDVDRTQMAIFLLRGMYGGAYTPQAMVGLFDDVPMGSWGGEWIERLYYEGITSGCSEYPLCYCPTADITRAQMSIFLLRAKYGQSYYPPGASGSMFYDVPINHWACPWIEQLASEGISTGCGNGLFCPEDPVDRAQMAVFLFRTFNL